MSRNRDDDRHLVERVIRHDERAFSALYDRHTPYLYRLALRLTGGDEARARDIVHDAWVRAVDRLARFEWRAQIRTWLAGFVINVAREHMRDEPAGLPLDEAVGEDEPPLPGGIERVDLERALSILPPGFRQVLVLHDIEGYTHEEIAGLLGVEPGTSKSQLSRARAAMRRLLTGETMRSSRG